MRVPLTQQVKSYGTYRWTNLLYQLQPQLQLILPETFGLQDQLL
jgi:hypothetical protein